MSEFNLDKFKSKTTGYVIRNGKRIAVETLKPKTPARKKRRPFKVKWVKLPAFWIERLRQSNNASTLKLAHYILLEAFRRKHIGGEIVLSTEATELQRHSRRRAVLEMVKMDLIEIKQRGKEAPTVTQLLNMPQTRTR